jgi:DNA repair ATPase RecN
MQNLPEIVVGIVVAMFGWFLKDKMAGVKEIDMKLSDKIDKLLEMVYELKAAIKGIDDLTSRMSRVEDRLENLESLNREKR